MESMVKVTRWEIAGLLIVMYSVFLFFGAISSRGAIIVTDAILLVVAAFVSFIYGQRTLEAWRENGEIDGLALIRCGISWAWASMAGLSATRLYVELFSSGGFVFSVLRFITIIPSIFAAILHIIAIGADGGKIRRSYFVIAAAALFIGLSFGMLILQFAPK